MLLHGYLDPNDLPITKQFCGIPGEALVFSVKDTGGDGLCCCSGAGYYALQLGDTVVASRCVA